MARRTHLRVPRRLAGPVSANNPRPFYAPRVSEIGFLVGRTVVEVRYDERVVFEAGTKPEPRLYADVGYAVCLDSSGEPVSVGELLGRKVAEASNADGVLRIAFTDGTTLQTEPDASVEAWQVVGGAPQALVVCLPGGEVAVVRS